MRLGRPVSPPSEKLRIARAAHADVAELVALGVSLVAAERQAAIVRESVAAGRCFVARFASGAAGFITWDRGFFNRPFVRLLAVAPLCRRLGVGCALLQRVECEAAQDGELFISTEQSNAVMQALLKRQGYETSGSLDHINEPGNLEIVYYKPLSSGVLAWNPSAEAG